MTPCMRSSPRVKAWESNENFLVYGFSWPESRRGMIAFLRTSRLLVALELVLLAGMCLRRQCRVAATLFKKIGDNWDIEVWDTEPASRRTGSGRWKVYPRPSKLELAIRDGNTYEVEGLLNSGADAKTTTIDGDSLALVAIKDEPGILSLLLEAGADPNLAAPGEEAPCTTRCPRMKRHTFDCC